MEGGERESAGECGFGSIWERRIAGRVRRLSTEVDNRGSRSRLRNEELAGASMEGGEEVGREAERQSAGE